MTAGLPLIKNEITPLAKSVSITLGLTSAATATDPAIQKKIYGSGRPSDLALPVTALIISDEKMDDIMNIVKSLEESDLLIKGVGEAIENEAKGGFI